MNKLNIFVCPICGGVFLGYGKAKVECCGKLLSAVDVEIAAIKPIITEMDGEYLLEFDNPMTKEDYLAAIVVERYDQVTLHRLFPEQAAQVRLPQVKGAKVYAVHCRKSEVKAMLAQF